MIESGTVIVIGRRLGFFIRSCLRVPAIEGILYFGRTLPEFASLGLILKKNRETRITKERMQQVFGGEIVIEPQCPHCGALFEDWMRAKTHVKFCAKGPSARKKSTAKRGKTDLEIYTEVVNEMKLDQGVLGSGQQLLPGMVHNLGDTAKIVGVRPAGTTYQFSDVCVDLQFGKKKVELPVKFINEDFQELAAKLGLDTDKWSGKTVHVYTEPYRSNRTKKESEIIRFELSGK